MAELAPGDAPAARGDRTLVLSPGVRYQARIDPSTPTGALDDCGLRRAHAPARQATTSLLVRTGVRAASVSRRPHGRSAWLAPLVPHPVAIALWTARRGGRLGLRSAVEPRGHRSSRTGWRPRGRADGRAAAPVEELRKPTPSSSRRTHNSSSSRCRTTSRDSPTADACSCGCPRSGCARAARSCPFAFLLIDLDHFGLVNDTPRAPRGRPLPARDRRHVAGHVRRPATSWRVTAARSSRVLTTPPNNRSRGALQLAVAAARLGIEGLGLAPGCRPGRRADRECRRGRRFARRRGMRPFDVVVEAADRAAVSARSEGRNRVAAGPRATKRGGASAKGGVVQCARPCRRQPQRTANGVEDQSGKGTHRDSDKERPIRGKE
jgi:hypothetical protein